MFAASSNFPKRHIWGFNQDDEKRLPVHIQPAPIKDETLKCLYQSQYAKPHGGKKHYAISTN